MAALASDRARAVEERARELRQKLDDGAAEDCRLPRNSPRHVVGAARRPTGQVPRRRRDAIKKAVDVASEIRAWAGRGVTSPGVIEYSQQLPGILELLEKVNKTYTTFQLARAAIDPIRGGRTESARGHAAVSAMGTAVSAGGTLLGASAGLTLYSNLYLGPMIDACMSMIAKLEDMRSKSWNRTWIALGGFDSVIWSLEPGGRPVFDFMLAVMRASDSSGVPLPGDAAASYIDDQQESFTAGLGGGSNETPTTGWWFWERLDRSRVRSWAFRNRASLWGMLYGDCPVPGR